MLSVTQEEIFSFLKKAKVSGRIVSLEKQSSFLADYGPALSRGGTAFRGGFLARHFGITESQAQHVKKKWETLALVSRIPRENNSLVVFYVEGEAFPKSAKPISEKTQASITDFGRLVTAYESLVSFYKEHLTARRA